MMMGEISLLSAQYILRNHCHRHTDTQTLTNIDTGLDVDSFPTLFALEGVILKVNIYNFTFSCWKSYAGEDGDIFFYIERFL